MISSHAEFPWFPPLSVPPLLTAAHHLASLGGSPLLNQIKLALLVIKFLFGQFPPFWLTYFKGALVPISSYNFLDRQLITVLGYLHFTEEVIFITNHHTHIEDVICTKPELAQFTCTPRTPENSLLYITPPRKELPL